MSVIALIGIILQVAKFIPDLLEIIEKWREIYKRVPARERFAERGAFGRELQAALGRKAAGVKMEGCCPVADHVEEFAKRYQVA